MLNLSYSDMFFFKKIIFFLTFFVFLSAASLVEAAVLILDPSSATVFPGSEFDMKIYIDTQGEEVTSADILLNYNNSFLEVVDVVNGAEGQIPFFTDLFHTAFTNQLYIGSSVTDPNDAHSGQGAVATVRLKALAQGTASIAFICSPGQTDETNISRSDQNATDIVDCNALSPAVYSITQNSATLQSVRIHAHSKTATIGKRSVGLSALAYDQTNNPIWSGVTYEWGISSSNSVGSLDPLQGTISNFIPLRAGTGDIFVVARMGNQMQASGVQMTVVAPPNIADISGDGKVTIVDLSILLSNFGKTNATKILGDVTGDGRITIQDLSLLLAHFGS